MVLPALISMVFTLASPPPGLIEMEKSALSVTIEKSDWKWIVMQIVNCIFFPIAAVGRYCHQIFWWIEAVFASCASDEARTKEALHRARAPSPLELYLFLQAFIHSAPHVILNILDLMYNYQNPVFDKVTVQAVSIVASTLRMASTATTYRRFEREKICGRKYPWQLNADDDDDDSKDKDEKAADINEDIDDLKDSQSQEHIYETLPTPKINDRSNANSDMIQFSPAAASRQQPWFEDESDSGNDSDYVPQENLSRNSQRVSINSDDEYMRPISIVDRVAPRRRDTEYTVERVEIIPPPLIPAPRPMSLAAWADKLVENAEAIPNWLNAPYRSKYYIPVERLNQLEPEIPRRVPPSFTRGLEPQDITAAFVQYLGWYAFFVARVLSIAAFINCVPVAAIIILFSHYQIMLLLLIVPQGSTIRKGFYIFLAFIYLFCLMEFKIRFRHVRVWHVFWMIVCTIENILFISLWTFIDNSFGDFWKFFTVKVTLIGMLLSYMCMLVYFMLLQPKETIVPINSRKDSVKT